MIQSISGIGAFVPPRSLTQGLTPCLMRKAADTCRCRPALVLDDGTLAHAADCEAGS